MQRTFSLPAAAGAESDEPLLDLARAGDGEAFASLAMRHWATVYSFARNLLADDAAPTEVAEAVFVSALRPNGGFRRGEPFLTSLYRTALRECRRFVSANEAGRGQFGEAGRGHLDHAGRPLADDLLPRLRAVPAGFGFADASAAEVFPLASCSAAWIRQALQRAAPTDRAAFLLREVEQLPVEQAAAVLEVPAAVVRERTHRATVVVAGLLANTRRPAELPA